MTGAIPRPVERLVEAFARLPGVGPKTASRLTYHLLRSAPEESLELAEALGELRAGTIFCGRCFNISTAGVDPCALCVDPSRSAHTLCVVEEPLDVLAIERTGAFHGRYHVLHGALSPVEGIGPQDLRIEELAAGYDNPQEFIDWHYADRKRLAEIESKVMEDQAVELLLATATVVDKPMTFQELMRPGQQVA